jgi:hypothetical protein
MGIIGGSILISVPLVVIALCYAFSAASINSHGITNPELLITGINGFGVSFCIAVFTAPIGLFSMIVCAVLLRRINKASIIPNQTLQLTPPQRRSS